MASSVSRSRSKCHVAECRSKIKRDKTPSRQSSTPDAEDSVRRNPVTHVGLYMSELAYYSHVWLNTYTWLTSVHVWLNSRLSPVCLNSIGIVLHTVLRNISSVKSLHIMHVSEDGGFSARVWTRSFSIMRCIYGPTWCMFIRFVNIFV